MHTNAKISKRLLKALLIPQIILITGRDPAAEYRLDTSYFPPSTAAKSRKMSIVFRISQDT